MIKFLGLGKKKEPEKIEASGKGFLPVDKVKQLSSKGFSEPEIIDVLRKEGFSAEEIDRALTQALTISVTGEEQTQQLPTLKELQTQSSTGVDVTSQLFDTQQQEQEQPIQPAYQEYPQDSYSTEELVEAIVHERMVELDDRLEEFKEKYTSIERKISDIHHRLEIISKGRSQEDDDLFAKISQSVR